VPQCPIAGDANLYDAAIALNSRIHHNQWRSERGGPGARAHSEMTNII